MMMMAALVAAAMESLFLGANTTTLLLVGASCFILGYVVAAAAPPVPSRCVRSAFSWVGPFVTSRVTRDVYDDGDNKEDNTKRKKRQPESSAALEIENLAEILEDFKMVLVVRNDLKMGKGKIAAQCSHATLGLYKKLFCKAPKALDRWEMCGQAKVVLKGESEEDLLILQERAKALKLPTHITIDAGRTQIAPNSRTVMAILGPINVVDDVTDGLKLL